MFEFRTDLADERLEICKNNLKGVKSQKVIVSDNIQINRISIENEEGSKLLQKKEGKYVTIDFKNVNIIDENEFEEMKKIFFDELSKIMNFEKSFLVVGLGNRNTTADSIGPKVVENLNITRHIIKYAPELIPKETKEISAIAPGVLGTTGIETQEIVKGIIDKIEIDGIIVIDAVCSNNIDRLLKTIQINNTGIIPGGGVENARKEISKETMGIPVIAIGVPTVVEAATIVTDTLEKINDEFNYEEKHSIIKNVLKNSELNYAVMPKEIDDLVDNLKEIIANGINNLA